MAGPAASLAACQKNALTPTRVDVAIHLAGEIARGVQAAQARKPAGQEHAPLGTLTPDNVLVGYDGSVELTDAAGAQPSYLAPEQLTGSDVDRRADVFSLGIVVWELLTSRRLFARGTAVETRIAVVEDPMPSVREANPDVPTTIADVLGTALQRDRNARFDTVEAFSKALGSARDSLFLAAATKQDIVRWVTERVPPPAAPSAVPDLDLPGAPAAHRSQPKMAAAKAPGSIPAFDVSAMAAAALAPSTRGSVPSAPPLSGRASVPSAPSHGGGRSIAIEAGNDDDDFDMEIERNGGPQMPMAATSARPSGMQTAPRKSGGMAGAGLDLAQPSRMTREGAGPRSRGRYEPGVGLKLAGALVTLAVASGTVFALLRFVHRAGGHDVTSVLPHAFDGSSAPESGAVSLVALVLAGVVGFIGFRLKPHAWPLVVSGGVMLLLALAMVTATLASTGENPTPPDGVLLVPYLFPAAVVLLALGIYSRAARTFTRAQGARRLGALPLAAVAGVLAFVAFEISRFAR